MRRLTALTAVLLLLPIAKPADATRQVKSCPDVVIAPNSGDLWADVKVVGVTCTYADRFLRRTSLPPGWRYKIVARNLRSVCGGNRIRYLKANKRITASRSAC